MILWRVTGADVAIASVRYRAVLPALHLATLGYESRFSSRHEALPASAKIDAVIFVKAFSEDDLRVAATAHRHRIPVVLDICDNIFVKGYSSFGARTDIFRRMASIASAIVTTGEKLSGVVRKETGGTTPVMIVPDAAESAADREQVERVLAEWQLFGPALRTYFRLRGQAREHGALRTMIRGLVHWGAVAAARADKIPGRPLRFITTPARIAFRASRRFPKHARSLPKIVVQRVREEGLKWIIRGMARRIRRLIDHLSRVSWRSTTAANAFFVSASPGGRGSIGAHSSERVEANELCRFNRPAATATDCKSKLRNLIWFGNHGASYSHFGLADLADLQSALCKVSERHAIRLIVISNSEARYNELIRPFPFATHYIPWRLGVVEDWLKQSEIALLPNSLDAFNVCKSANRAVLALSHGVPVVATRTPALAPFEDCVIVDDWVWGIETYLGNPQLVKQHITDAQVVIEREFSGESIARKWDALLRQVVSERSSVQGYRQPNLIDDSR